MNKQERELRDLDIYLDWKTGVKQKDLAKNYNLTPVRICQIIAKMKKQQQEGDKIE